MHTKAWDLVAAYVRQNLEFFPGKAIEAESTILPSISGWIHQTLSDIPEPSISSAHPFFSEL
jgi:hypothetical protein